jgi:hypothetical protein
MPITLNGNGPIAGATTVNGLTLPTDSLQPGMVLVATSTFSAASSVSVNNCFTSAYENYKIVWTANSVTASGAIYMRLRASGSDNTTSNYGSSGTFTIFTGAVSGTGYSAQNYWAIHFAAGTGAGSHQRSIEIIQPQVASNTSFGAVGSNNDANAYYAGWFYNASQFDGFTILPASGTMTGTIRVYGYRNS